MAASTAAELAWQKLRALAPFSTAPGRRAAACARKTSQKTDHHSKRKPVGASIWTWAAGMRRAACCCCCDGSAALEDEAETLREGGAPVVGRFDGLRAASLAGLAVVPLLLLPPPPPPWLGSSASKPKWLVVLAALAVLSTVSALFLLPYASSPPGDDVGEPGEPSLRRCGGPEPDGMGESAEGDVEKGVLGSCVSRGKDADAAERD